MTRTKEARVLSRQEKAAKASQLAHYVPRHRRRIIVLMWATMLFLAMSVAPAWAYHNICAAHGHSTHYHNGLQYVLRQSHHYTDASGWHHMGWNIIHPTQGPWGTYDCHVKFN